MRDKAASTQQSSALRLPWLKETGETTSSAADDQVAHKPIGSTLGEAQDGDESTAAWIQRQKSATGGKAIRQSQHKSQSTPTTYTPQDLSGLRVGHDLDAFKEGSEHILVLRDSTILEEMEGDDDGNTSHPRGDELVGLDLLEHETAQKNIENRKGIPAPNSDSSHYYGLSDGPKPILSKYDGADVTGNSTKKSSFILKVAKGKSLIHGTLANGKTQSVSLPPASLPPPVLPGRKLISLDGPNGKSHTSSISDYFDPLADDVDDQLASETIAFKKSASSQNKKKRSRRKPADDETVVAGPSLMEIDKQAAPTSFSFSNKLATVNSDVNFVDDDDLQAALAKTRRQQVHRFKSVEDSMAEEVPFEESIDQGSSFGGLVISEAVEFVNHLSVAASVSSSAAGLSASATITQVTASVPVEMTQLEQVINDDTYEKESGEESEGEDGEPLDDERSENKVEELLEEPLVSSSLGATVALLAQKGYIKRSTKEERELEHQQMERQRWIVEEKLREAQLAKQAAEEKERQRAINRAKGGFGGGRQDTEERLAADEAQRRADLLRAKEVEERFKDYKPDISIKYHDDLGRELNPREAYKFLSHKFHGISSGKTKAGKKLQKIHEDLQKQKMSSQDTPLNIARAVSKRTEETGSAHIVLSVGNRKSIPEESMSDLKVRAEKLKAMTEEKKAALLQPASASADSVPASKKREIVSSSLGMAIPPPPAFKKPETLEAVATTEKRGKIAFGMGSGLGTLKRKQNPNPLI